MLLLNKYLILNEICVVIGFGLMVITLGEILAVMCKGISSDICCTMYTAFLNKELAIVGKLETDMQLNCC